MRDCGLNYDQRNFRFQGIMLRSNIRVCDVCGGVIRGTRSIAVGPFVANLHSYYDFWKVLQARTMRAAMSISTSAFSAALTSTWPMVSRALLREMDLDHHRSRACLRQ
jgi:hypothetical protein